MADIIILGNFYADSTTQNTPAPTETVKKTKNNILSIGILIGVIAAYLSWTCNTSKGISTVEKVIYALFAYLFGGLYLIYYFLVHYPCGVSEPAYYYF